MGILLGLLTGYGLQAFFEWAYRRDHLIRNSVKVILILAFAFLLLVVEETLEGVIAVSGLLAVVSMALMIRNRSGKMVADRLSEKFGKLWLAAEPVLFVLVGAAVDIRYTFAAGLPVLLLIALALLFRSVGVWLSTKKTPLSVKERVFCVIS